MTHRRITRLIAPAAWANAIVNMDYSGMSIDDARACNTFLAREGFSFSDCLCCKPAGFRRRHDAFAEAPVAAECCEYQFARRD